MRSNLLTSFAAMAVAVLCVTQLPAQQNTDEKKVIVTIRNTDPDGSEVTRTIIKKGKAAEGFDTKQYIYENTRDKRDAVVLIGDDAVNALDGKNGCSKTCTTPDKATDQWKYKWQDEPKAACLGAYASMNNDRTDIGPKVAGFMTGSAAQEAEMQAGDFITGINGATVVTYQELWNEIAKYKPEDRVKVAFTRDGKQKQVQVTLKACDNKNGKANVKSTAPESAERGSAPDYERRLYVTAFTAYPNPAQDFVNVQFTAEAAPISVSLLDLTGKVLYTKNYDDFSGSFEDRFDLSSYPKGNLVLQVLQGDKVYTHQITVF